jgi:hypothetical protein
VALVGLHEVVEAEHDHQPELRGANDAREELRELEADDEVDLKSPADISMQSSGPI